MRAPKRWTLVGVAAMALLAAVPVVTTLAPKAATAAEAQPGDGTTSATAGASCWGIKQAFPSSADGVYWLLTGSLDRPAQFFCDQTTGGGGWVLVGRGRDSWNFTEVGQGSPASLRSTTSGPGAFAAAALDRDTIDDLLDNQPVSALADGIRVRRATNTSGSNAQDLRLFPAYSAWTWSLGAGQKLSRVSIDGQTWTNSNTRDTGSGFYDYPSGGLAGQQGLRRMYTYATSANSWKSGFAYGSGLSGSTAADTNLYKTASGTVLPFSQVWLRPRIANNATTFTPVPTGGFAPETNAPSLKNRPETAPWGVVGLNHTNEESTTPWYTAANVIKAYGNRVYVGGRFTHVQQGPGGAQVAQGSLAAFDLDGNWISTFRPQVAGRVWDLTMTDDGKLIVGGDFTSIDGQAGTTALAALDPVTGQVVPGWRADVTRTTGSSIVRALDSRGGWIYAAGRFNRVKGGSANLQTVSSAVNLRTSDGVPGSWKPILTGTAVKVRAAAAGDRVYLAGYFNAVNADANMGYHAITDATTGANAPGIGPWRPSVGSNAKYQQAVAETGDRILVGGSEHDFQIYDRNRTTLLDANITKSGGDTQAIEIFGDDLYMACHCDQYLFQGTNNWTSPTGFRSVNPIMLVGKFHTGTLDYDTSWFPSALKGARGDGVWSVSQDQRGCVWVAGDIQRGATSGNAAADWLGDFGRFCPTDTTPPTAPTNLKATVGTDSVALTWGGSTDTGGTVSYDVYRNDRVVATVYGTTFSDPVASGTTNRYTVRAADSSGNRSASPAPIAVNGPAPQLAQAVAFGATWSYRADGTDLGTAWRTPGFDAAGWAAGPAPLGYGPTTLGTVVSTGKPLTTYVRRTFSLADASQVKALDLQLKVNSGAVVYVNGVEAGRVNMPTGTVTAATPAASYICCAEEARLKQLVVPASLLVSGTNTIAVEAHGWIQGASRAFIDLQATALGTNGDTAAPSAPTLTAARSAAGVDLTWTPSSDDKALGGYEIQRDGAPLAVVGPLGTSFTDGSASPTTAHRYEVVAFDTNGNRTTSAPVTLTVQADPNLLTYGSSWKWSYAGTTPVGAWTAPGYDDSTWATGVGNLGFGNANATVITAAPAPRPLTSYFRTTVDIADPAAFRAVLVGLVRDSGAAVYVNGVEVNRSNLPAGPLTADTYASAWVGAADRKKPVTFEVPSSAFVAGTNTIAVELHLNGRSQATAGFDLSLTGVN